MSLKNVITDIMDKLREIEEIQFVHVYNNQFQLMQDQNVYSFPFPCAFVEIISQPFLQIGGGYQHSDLDIRIHIGHNEYDSADTNMEQNFNVYSLRDLVVKKLSLYKPSMCSELFKINEQQDYAHSNIYKYIVDFRTGFTDNTASTLIEPELIDPITLELDVVIESTDGDLEPNVIYKQEIKI